LRAPTIDGFANISKRNFWGLGGTGGGLADGHSLPLR